MEATHKQCTHCRDFKPLEAFTRSRVGKFGRHNNCKPCRSLSRKRQGELLRLRSRANAINIDRLTFLQTMESAQNERNAIQGRQMAVPRQYAWYGGQVLDEHALRASVNLLRQCGIIGDGND